MKEQKALKFHNFLIKKHNKKSTSIKIFFSKSYNVWLIEKINFPDCRL